MTQEDQTIDTLIHKYEGSWQAGYAAFPERVCKLGLRIGVEVGVAFGGHARAILEQRGVDKLYGVDSYQHRDDYDDPMNLPQAVFDRLAKRVVDRLSIFQDRFEQIREDSVTASRRFEDGSLDFVYLDADHSEAGLIADLCAWFPKVREGGIIAGHDLDHPDFPGVSNAIHRFFSRFGWQPEALGHGVWTITKQARPVTFFTPAYNAAPFLAEAARSLIENNMRPGDEYIIVDDASTDDTAAIVSRIAAMDERVTILRHTENKGGGAARNTALAQANAQLFFCLDADNVLLPGSVDRLRDEMDRHASEVVCFGRVDYFRDEPTADAVTHSHEYAHSEYSLAEYVTTCRVPGSSGNYLFARSNYDAAGGYPTSSGALDTWGFGLRQVANGGTMLTVPGTSYLHRDGHSSYWTRYAKSNAIDEHAFELIEPFLDQLDPRDAARLRSKRRRKDWFKRIGDRPLRTRPAAPQTMSTNLTITTLPRTITKAFSRLLNRAAA
ncbi:MAG: glycosyltransferase [Phycisphaeraceae bacterium]